MDEWIMERLALAAGRVEEIGESSQTPSPFRDFFEREAGFLKKAMRLQNLSERVKTQSLDDLASENKGLYEDLFPERYASCYGNPAYAAQRLGEEYGKPFCFLYGELSAAPQFAAEGDAEGLTILLELFLQVHASFSQEDLLSPQEMNRCLSDYAWDYCQDMVRRQVRRVLDPNLDFAARIVEEADLEDFRYLYRYGEYISEEELGTARFLGSLPQEEIDAMAHTWADGYIRGFAVGGKDLSRKKTVNLRYRLGFERVVRRAVLELREAGLAPVIYRHPRQAVVTSLGAAAGYVGGDPNPQYAYDHRQDAALFLSPDFAARRSRALQEAYEEYQTLAAVHGGPAVLETFGEEPFQPVACPQALCFTPSQQQVLTRLRGEAAQITNRYIKGEERSFTIIAFPLPSIGKEYPAIFREVEKVNTLDNSACLRIQQLLIDSLDKGTRVHIQGRGENETDLFVSLHPLQDPLRQTNFENCVADVNIPAGEVFTSPVLSGTTGRLHVSRVYLSGLEFVDLKLDFEDGMIKDYDCANFSEEGQNRRYIEENILFHHESLPMGEFAIGTNTLAYAMANRFGIAPKLPILIAEKMGPHFAVGDTCYSWEEDHPVYNPDGKEVIARENEVSALRKTRPDQAYFDCHTDITLPYEELGAITVLGRDGYRALLLEGGRFVLPGTQDLNQPLEELQEYMK